MLLIKASLVNTDPKCFSNFIGRFVGDEPINGNFSVEEIYAEWNHIVVQLSSHSTPNFLSILSVSNPSKEPVNHMWLEQQ